LEDYMSADDWAALARLQERAKRGLAAASISAAQADKLVRRGYVSDNGHGYVVTPSGRTAITNWERSRRS
jgi:hypothetical protein